jgi:hypothetical protein
MNYKNAFGHQSSIQANGQALNKGSLLAGLTRESAVKPNTGTATGDQAVKDFAKSQTSSAQAQMGRALEKQGAEIQWNKQQAKEQQTQQGRTARMNRYQQSSQQAVSQMDLAARMRQAQIDMQSQWQTGLLGLLR